MGIPIAVVAQSSNVKTGNIPTVWVGRNLAQSRESCDGCPLLASGDCYAQYGSPSFAIASVARSAKRSKSWRRYTIERAIAGKHRDARFVRFTALGDAARADRAQVKHAIAVTRANGLAVVGYTHFHRERSAQWLRGQLMASVQNVDEARDANARGWRAAIVMPRDTVGTLRNDDGSILAVECPAIAASRLGKTFTCNDCASTKRGALCDASRDLPNVYFADHGPRARRSLPVVR